MSYGNLDSYAPFYEQKLKEHDALTKQVQTIIQSRLIKIEPIVEWMHTKHLKFSHPSLPGVKTTHGVILGRNTSNPIEIYTYETKSKFLKRVNANTDEVVDGSAFFLVDFLKYCDLEFAILGIERIESFPKSAVAALEEQIGAKVKFLQKHGE